MLARILVVAAFGVVLGVPWLFRPQDAPSESSGAQRLVIITPNNEQIRYEFGVAFDRWHREHYDQPAVIDWRQPGGTSDIRRQLIAQYTAAVQTGRITTEGTLRKREPMPYDLFWSGGSFEHNETRKGVRATPIGTDKEVTMPMSVPMGFETAQLDAWFGENKIGSGQLHDPERYWLGTVLSGFGIVYNRDVLRELGLPDPISWKDMTDPRLAGWVALADPRQSGSVATTYDAILNFYGWDEGWRILRMMSANARYFSATSARPPLDVSQGLAAMGVAIDFYGRYQAQSLMRPGESPETSRVGYIDPPGATLIDADPVSIMRAGPNPELARRYVEFMLTEEAQALWQFPAKERAAGIGADGLGPERFELRRMPIRRVMYEKYAKRMVDRIDPYAAAMDAPLRGWRSAINILMPAFGIDVHEEQTQAWKAIREAKSRGATPDLIAEAEALFFAWPTHTIPAKEAKPGEQSSETTLEINEKNYAAIRADWRDAEKDGRMALIKIEYTNFFRKNYKTIVQFLKDGAPG